MKIICTVTNDLTYDQRMIRIGNSLVKAGYEVLLVGRLRHFSKPIKKEVFQQKRLKCWFNKGKLFYLEYNIRLFFFLLLQPYDVVCSIDLDTILPGFWVSRIKNRVCVYDAHEYFTEVPEVVHRPKVQRIWEWVAQTTIPKIKYAYTVCDSIAEILEKRYGTPFKTIRNMPFKRGDDLLVTDKQPTPLAKPSILLYQGALNEGRGLEQLIEAMQYLPNALLWLVGEGDLSEKLRQIAKDFKVEDKIKFWGYQTPDVLQSITPQATIGCNLLENKGLSYYYSLANKAFDYIQAGLPSIHSNFPEYQRINQEIECFVLVDGLEIEEIVKKLRWLLEDKAHYQKLRENCQLARKRYIWEQEEKKLIHFYESIVKHKGI